MTRRRYRWQDMKQSEAKGLTGTRRTAAPQENSIKGQLERKGLIVITTKHPGRCAGCGQRVEVGTRIGWSRNLGSFCLRCTFDGK